MTECCRCGGKSKFNDCITLAELQWGFTEAGDWLCPKCNDKAWGKGMTYNQKAYRRQKMKSKIEGVLK